MKETVLSNPSTPVTNTDFTSLGTYDQAVVGSAVRCVLPSVLALAGPLGPKTRVLDVGCGLGALAAEFARRGCSVVGVDLDEHNLEAARRAYPSVRFEKAAANADVLSVLNEEPFDLVTCTEVIEHVYSPRALMAGCFAATKPGGRFIITAPYHGYLKNLAIALLNKGDDHYAALWEGGHIKFFSRASMSELMRTTGFHDIRFRGAGRMPYLWMSLVMSADRPSGA